MVCPRCQAENPVGMRFCGQCAAPMAAVCASCGASNSLPNRFCGQCAAPLGKVADPRLQSPDAYTPKHLAERILTSKAALEGERKQVTVLFADLKGSMELLADRDPEEARKILDPVLTLMMDAVHRYEGTVNQVMGDGIMALFGAPLAHEDHAVRACFAALRMQETVKRYAEDARHAHGVNVQIRVGLNSGEVVVRAIGSDLHMDYTAVGQTTHLAARMEQFASPGSVLLTAATLELVEGQVAVTPLGPVPVKGLADAVEVYEATGAGPARTRLQAAARRGLTRFVGRDAEVEHLRRVLGLAGAGHGQVAAVVGEAGVGKSRLTYEFTHSHRVQDWLIQEASSVSYGKATSYLPVIDLLKGYFKIGDRDDYREMRAKVLGRVLGLDRALEPLLPPLLALLDVPVEDAAWQSLDPAQRRQLTLDAVKRLLLRESQVQPLLVVFEDLHWIDDETQALLDSLVESLGSARLLLLVNYRPEYEHRWGSKTAYSQLRLDSLPAASAAELLAALLGPEPELVPLTQMLVKRGNPFFLEETVRTLVETGALVGARGAYRLTRPVEAIEVPATVQVILAARIDRLLPDDKQLLQTASVVGKDVPLALLHAVAEAGEEAVQRGLTHLQAAEFVYETRLFPEPEYTFKHALTHEVTYGTLLQGRRKVLHARIVGAIERCYPDRLSEHVEWLAHHAVRGELWQQAVAYLRQAGVKALARSGSREAAAAFEQAMAALPHLAEGRTTVEQGIDLRFELRQALQALGEHQRVVDYLGEAEALAATLDDQRRLGWASAYLSQYFGLRGEPERASEAGQRALTIGGASGDFGLQVSAHFFLGQFAHWSSDYPRAQAHLRWTVDALTEDRVRERFGQSGLPAVLARSLLAWGMAELGEFTEAAAYADEAVQMAEFVGQPYSLLMAYLILGFLHLAKGDAERALPPLQRALALYETWNLGYFFPWIAQGLGLAYARGDRTDEAMPLLERAIARHPALLRSQRAPLHATLGEVYLLAGRPDAADEEARRALAVAQECRTRGSQAWALRLLGEVAARRDPPEHAEGHYRDALVLAEELGMRPLVAHCHLGLGKLYRRTGQSEQARERLTTAATMYRGMGMTYWLEDAERC